jgi:hypothetical protein
MRKKSADVLKGRTVVGFDLRRSSALNNLFLTSYDDSVRFEDFLERFSSYRSAINLFAVDPSSIPSVALPKGAQVVAFDLPTPHVDSMIKQGVSSPEPLPTLALDRAWKFAGFDVVDARTQTSAFHGFDLSPPGPASNSRSLSSITFNAHGLIDDEKDAFEISKYFDSIFPEHAPFVPSGVWLKRPPSGR